MTVVLPATIFAFVMRSSSVTAAVRIGGPLRWLLLLALVACAVPYGLSHVRLLPRHFLATVAALVGVSLLSATWSVAPKLSAERAISFLLLMVAVICISAAASHSPARAERLFLSILVAADLVALAGLFLVVVDHNLAIQSSWSQMPARMRGFGQNPNTVSMLFALTLPFAEWLVVSARSRWLRITAVASCMLLFGSIFASGSRGALVAAAAGTILFVALSVRGLQQLLPAEALVIALFLAAFHFGDTRPPLASAVVLKPLPPPVVVPATPRPTKPSTKVTSATPVPGASRSQLEAGSTAPPASSLQVGLTPGLSTTSVTVPFIPREDEIGYPSFYTYKPILAYGSGRVFAWLWAIRQGLEAPVLGYGFGTENKVFVDRFFYFQGDFTENSFVGVFLQVGVVGVLLLLLPFVFGVVALVRVLRRPEAPERAMVSAAAAVVVAGFVIAFFQSYLYSVGNVATLPFWLAAAVAIGLGSGKARWSVP